MPRDQKARYILEAEDRTKLAMRSAEANFNKFNRSVKSTLTSLGGFGALAGGASLAALVSFGKEAIIAADRVDKLSQVAGLSAESFQFCICRLRYPLVICFGFMSLV